MSLPGYRIKLHNSLLKPIFLAYAPRKFTILNSTVCASLVLGLHSFCLLPLFMILHCSLAILTKHDPYFFEILLNHIRKKKYYST